MRTMSILAALILLLAVCGCTPAGTTAVEDTPLDEVSEQSSAGEAAAISTPVEPTAEATASSTPEVPTTESAATLIATEEVAPTSTPVVIPEPVSIETASQIYAAAVRQMYGVEHSFGGDPPEFPLVYIRTITDDGSQLYAPVTPPQRLTAALQQTIADELSDQPFEIIWVESIDEVPIEEAGGIKIAEGQGIFITPGNIMPQPDGTVQLPFYMLCGTLCLSGKTYVLEQVDGAWQVTGNVGAEVEG